MFAIPCKIVKRAVLLGFLTVGSCGGDKPAGVGHTGSGGSMGGSVGAVASAGGNLGSSSGGAVGTGGTFTGGSGGGVGDGGSIGTELPECLRNLFAACPTVGSCISPDAFSAHQTICFDNGVRSEKTRVGGCEGNGHVDLTVRKADGSVCYTNEVKQGVICEGETFVWKDPSGVVVATGSAYATDYSARCAADGEVGGCPEGQCRLGSAWFTPRCEVGMCSAQ